jgi:hypothetical protein
VTNAKIQKDLIFLIPSTVTATAIDSLSGSAQSAWAIDELAIALTRTTLVRNARIAIPTDNAFAPLVAQIALQYLAPRFAEENTARTGTDPRRRQERSPITFVATTHLGAWQDALNRFGWMQLFSQISGFPATEIMLGTLLEAHPPVAAISLGSEEAIDPVLRACRSVGIPLWRLQDHRPNRNEDLEQSDIRDFESDLEAEGMSRREKLRLFRPSRDRSGFSRDTETEAPKPDDFNKYPPHILHAQILVDRILNGHRDPRPS